ncbi:MAG: hypothetical protein ACRERC_23125, partial [Candidatus Binatia bacterium]
LPAAALARWLVGAGATTSLDALQHFAIGGGAFIAVVAAGTYAIGDQAMRDALGRVVRRLRR